MKKSLKSLLGLTLLATLSLSACGGQPANNTTPAINTPAGTPAANGTLVMGTNAAFPPYEFKDDNNQFAGIDIDIANTVAEKLGKTLEIRDMEFNSLVPAVQSGSIDVALAGMTVNEERLQSVNFSDSYAKGIQVIIVPEGSAIKSPDDMTGKKIGVQTGTTGDIYCADDFGEDAVSRYDNGALAVQALKNGQVDCVVIDNEPAKAFVKANTGLSILDTSYADEDYAAAIAKDNTQLLDDFNKALGELKADGTLDTIIGKYIKAE